MGIGNHYISNLMEVPVDDNCVEDLRKLNQEMFDAEGKDKIGEDSWDEFLKKVLSEKFIIRRSNPILPNQSKEEMLAWIAEHPIIKRNLLEEETVVWCEEALGVVVCSVTMIRDEVLHKYQNIKVLNKPLHGNWQCIYWQVSEAPSD